MRSGRTLLVRGFGERPLSDGWATSDYIAERRHTGTALEIAANIFGRARHRDPISSGATGIRRGEP